MSLCDDLLCLGGLAEAQASQYPFQTFHPHDIYGGPSRTKI